MTIRMNSERCLLTGGGGGRRREAVPRLARPWVSKGEQVLEVSVSQIISSVSCVGPSPASLGQSPIMQYPQDLKISKHLSRVPGSSPGYLKDQWREWKEKSFINNAKAML